MKKHKLLKNKYFLLVVFAVISSLILTILYLPVEDSFISVTSQFDWSVNPDSTAPASVLQSLSISYPNFFSTCSFGDRIYYIDSTGSKHFLDGNLRDITPLTAPFFNSIISTQTNRNISDFTIDTHGSCSIKSLTGFNNVKAIADRGSLKLDIYYAKADGSMVKIYSKTTELNVKGLDLSTDKTLFSVKIPASELENKMTHTSDAYKSNIRIKPTLDLYLHYSGIDTTSWLVSGTSETNLKVTVNNDKFQCILACLVASKEIKTEFTPSDNQVQPKQIINFKVILPGWTSDQGSPSWKIVNAETGIDYTQSSQLVLTKSGDNGIGSKSLLSPSNVGKYDIVITKQGRDTAVISFNVYKKSVVPPECTDSASCTPSEKCPEGYVFIDGVCFLEEVPCTGASCNPPPGIDPTQFFDNFNPEDYYGYGVLLIIVLVIAVILKSVFKSSPPRY